MTLKYTLVAAFAVLGSAQMATAATERPVVLELYTSQGCSSCPPADALLRQLAVESSVLALSFHVNYWDYIGWKDPFSSQENSDRQTRYAKINQRGRVFTPELIVDGVRSVVGSNGDEVESAIRAARLEMVSVPMVLAPDATGKILNVHIGKGDAATPNANVLAVRFQRSATTEVKAGENNGRTLSGINNVLEVKPLGEWKNEDADYQFAMNDNAEEGVAILLQNAQYGTMLGAQTYREK